MDWLTLTRSDIERDALPPVCAHCGAAATGRHNRTFSWHPAWVGWLYWIGYLPGAVAASFVRKQMRVSLPVCQRHSPPSPFNALTLALGWLLLPAVLGGAAAGTVWLWMQAPGPDPAQLAAIRAQRDKLRAGGGTWDKAGDKGYVGVARSDDAKGIAEVAKARAEYEKAQEAARQVALEAEKRRRGELRELDALLEPLANAEKRARSRAEHGPEVMAWVLPAGIGLGLVIWLWAVLAFLRGRRWLRVQEITDEGITLVGFADAFVEAVKGSRPLPSPPPLPASGPDGSS
jgi:hypothetical protein